MSKNKIALVFGGTRGIGAATVKALAESGHDVAYTYVNSAPKLPAVSVARVLRNTAPP